MNYPQFINLKGTSRDHRLHPTPGSLKASALSYFSRMKSIYNIDYFLSKVTVFMRKYHDIIKPEFKNVIKNKLNKRKQVKQSKQPPSNADKEVLYYLHNQLYSKSNPNTKES